MVRGLAAPGHGRGASGLITPLADTESLIFLLLQPLPAHIVSESETGQLSPQELPGNYLRPQNRPRYIGGSQEMFIKWNSGKMNGGAQPSNGTCSRHPVSSCSRPGTEPGWASLSTLPPRERTEWQGKRGSSLVQTPGESLSMEASLQSPGVQVTQAERVGRVVPIVDIAQRADGDMSPCVSPSSYPFPR